MPLSERRAAKAVKAAKAAAEADAAVERPPPPGTALADALPLLKMPARHGVRERLLQAFVAATALGQPRKV